MCKSFALRSRQPHSTSYSCFPTTSVKALKAAAHTCSAIQTHTLQIVYRPIHSGSVQGMQKNAITYSIFKTVFMSCVLIYNDVHIEIYSHNKKQSWMRSRKFSLKLNTSSKLKHYRSFWPRWHYGTKQYINNINYDKWLRQYAQIHLHLIGECDC